MERVMSFLTGAAIGAVTMYYFDPDRGRGRRSVCEDQWMARGRRAGRNLDKAGRDLANRATGLVHEAGHVIRGDTPPEDGHRSSFDLMHQHLAPGTRLLLGTLGGGLFVWGLMEEAPEACVLGTLGAAMMLPAVTGRGAAGVFGSQGAMGQMPYEGQTEPSKVQGSAVGQRRGEPVPVM
jgi:hypothetical protein